MPQSLGHPEVRAPSALSVLTSGIVQPWGKHCRSARNPFLPVTEAGVAWQRSPGSSGADRETSTLVACSESRHFSLGTTEIVLCPHLEAAPDLVPPQWILPGHEAGTIWMSGRRGGSGLECQTSAAEIRAVPSDQEIAADGNSKAALRTSAVSVRCLGALVPPLAAALPQGPPYPEHVWDWVRDEWRRTDSTHVTCKAETTSASIFLS